jgi:uncharacterized damage-inducible protein DinB
MKKIIEHFFYINVIAKVILLIIFGVKMFKTIDEFLSEWANESQNTLKIFKALTNESLKTEVVPEGRTLGYIAWHITNTLGEMMQHAGLDIQPADGHNDEPVSVEQIIEEYQKLSEQMVKLINQNWTDETLTQDFNMYGEVWKGSDVLQSLIKHEIHHRAQMTILMRQAGLIVPGMYGPAKEEWIAYGMTPQK